MRNAVIGMVIGVVVGVVVGATFVAPRLTPMENAAPRSPSAERIVAGADQRQPVTETDTAAKPAAVEPQATEREPAADAALASAIAGKQTALAESPAQGPAEARSLTAPKPVDINEIKALKGKTGEVSGFETSVIAAAQPPRPRVPGREQAREQTPAPAPELAFAPAPRPAAIERLPAAPDPVRWRMGSAYASSLPQLGTLAKKLDRDIWRVSDGMLEIKFFEPGALVPPSEMFDAVRAGAIDAAFSSPGFWGDKVPALQLFASVPFGPTAKEFLAWIYFGGGQELFEEIYRANGIHSIFCGLIAPEASGWFRKRIQTVDDLKGLNMRVFGLGAKVMQRLGVNVSQVNEGDIFVALESGRIDAVEFSMPAVDLKLGLHRMAKNYYFPGWHQPATFLELMVNLDRWNTLTATQKAQVEAVCGDNIRHGLAEGEATQFAALKELQAEGVHIRRWPGEVLDALSVSWDVVAKEEARKNRNFRRVWNSLKGFRDNYAIWQELNRPY